MRRGFTLIEIMLSIALIAVMAGLAAGILLPSRESLESRSPESVIIGAVKQAKMEALDRGREVFLKMEDESVAVFDLESREEILKAKLPSGGYSEISFEALLPENLSTSKIFGYSPDNTLKRLRFSPDGSMTPARIVIKGVDGNKSYEIDPFNGSLVKKDG